MWNWNREKEYNCDWCEWGWCLIKHKAVLSYHWTSDIYRFETWRWDEIYMDTNTIKVFLELANDPIFSLTK